MYYLVSIPPSEEPISLADVKMHLRVIPNDDSEDEAILKPLITAAREYCENITGKALATQTVKAFPDLLHGIITLPRDPIQSITEVVYTDAEGNTTDITDYDYDPVKGTIVLGELPQSKPASTPVAITYVCGYADGELPKSIRQAMMLLIGHWYENREAVVVGAFTSVEIKLTVDTLLKQYKGWWF